MLISLVELKAILDQVGINYFRDDAPNNQKYPYVIYEYVQDIQVYAGNKVIRELQEYQLAYITTGIESELNPLKKALDENNVLFSPFNGMAYDENDDTVTQFVCYVRCKNAERI
ncbi:MAG: hypothetical protein ACOYEB_00605 [Enterococcus lemanii]|jgi:hypothetical protein